MIEGIGDAFLISLFPKKNGTAATRRGSVLRRLWDVKLSGMGEGSQHHSAKSHTSHPRNGAEPRRVAAVPFEETG